MEQIVKPARKTESKANLGLLTALTVSSGRKSGKYVLGKSDEKNGFYFEYYGVKVPFKALLNDNNKTRGIVGVAFGTAKDCPSRARGLCQLPTDKLCYARSGEARATKRDNADGRQGMDSYFNGVLCSEFWDAYAVNPALRNKFIDYLIVKDIETIRFNLKGDFRHEGDAVAIYHLAQVGFNLTGYTARDDMAETLEHLAEHERVILNGSNRMYTNRFKATADLQEYLNAKYSCLGSCGNCGKCYHLRGKEITVLIHGSGSETELNTADNRKFIIEAVETGLGLYFDADHFKHGKGLITGINRFLKEVSNMEFKTTKDFLKWLESGNYQKADCNGYTWTVYDSFGFVEFVNEDFGNIKAYAERNNINLIWGHM